MFAFPDLFPQKWLNPLMLLLLATLPQLILTLLNWKDGSLIWNEMDVSQRTHGLILFSFQIALLAGSAITGIVLRILRRRISPGVAGVLLVVPSIYLAAFVVQGQQIIPAGIPQWMLPSDQLLFHQFALTMPTVFFGLLRLVLLPTALEARTDFFMAAGVFLAAVFGWLPAMAVIIGLLPEPVAAFLMAITLFVAMALCLGAMLRFTACVYHAKRGTSIRSISLIALMLGLILPAAGMALNAAIPFPASFQTPGVYGVLLANAVFLMLPAVRNPWLHRFIWLGQCATFPFTLYFFLAFVSVLPVAPLAMFACGAGILILVPPALFVFHTSRIADGFCEEIRDGRRIVPAALGVCACLILPAWITGQAMVDRQQLQAAIRYFYSPEFSQNARFDGNPIRVRRTLVKLRDQKLGAQLPFISEFYNWMGRCRKFCVLGRVVSI
ncbi:MAG TPA: MSEP-CTERM sorting domain-containing protein [Chthoniobacterales bacterium]